jgi:hypothetical protein
MFSDYYIAIGKWALVNEEPCNLTVERFLTGMLDRITFLTDRHP